jgi:hypothetical protein
VWVPIPLLFNLIQFVVLDTGELGDRSCIVTEGRIQVGK